MIWQNVGKLWYPFQLFLVITQFRFLLFQAFAIEKKNFLSDPWQASCPNLSFLLAFRTEYQYTFFVSKAKSFGIYYTRSRGLPGLYLTEEAPSSWTVCSSLKATRFKVPDLDPDPPVDTMDGCLAGVVCWELLVDEQDFFTLLCWWCGSPWNFKILVF